MCPRSPGYARHFGTDSQYLLFESRPKWLDLFQEALRLASGSQKMDKKPYASKDKNVYQNVEELVKVFELQMRQLVIDILSKELGSSWLEKLSSTDGMQVCVLKWQEIAPKVLSENETILDYSTLGDLQRIITSPNY